MTKQESINKFLVEAEGGCWHEPTEEGFVLASKPLLNGRRLISAKCFKCGSYFIRREIDDFSDPKNFIRLLKIARKYGNLIGFTMLASGNCSFIVNGEITHSIENINNTIATLSELIAKSLGYTNQGDK